MSDESLRGSFTTDDGPPFDDSESLPPRYPERRSWRQTPKETASWKILLLAGLMLLVVGAVAVASLK